MQYSAYSISPCLLLCPMTDWNPGGWRVSESPQLKLKTEAITDDTELRFEYLPDAQALSQLSFYFTAEDEGVYTDGRIDIGAYDAQTRELLASASYDLQDLGAEGFWGVDFTQEPVGQAVEVVITGKGIKNGPYIWLNTETETAGTSYEDGQILENNLIFNAVYRTQVHYVKKPLITTLMLTILGAMFFLVSGKKQEKATKKRDSGLGKKAAAFGRKLKTFYEKHKKLLGLGLLLFITALMFLYVYDVQIRKAMNSTHREVVMKTIRSCCRDSGYTGADSVLYHRRKTVGGVGCADGSGREFCGRGADSRRGL